MLFNSVAFIFAFLPVALLVFWQARRWNVTASNVALVIASFAFYYLGENSDAILLLISIAFNLSVGTAIYYHKRYSGLLLAIGVIVNLSILFWYKYANFFVESLGSFVGTSVDWTLPGIDSLPIGVSFFTFTQIAYLVDAYRRQVSEHGVVSYSLFVSYFPHLIAGPILHHKEMIPQFQDRSLRFSAELISVGLTIFAVGLFKKVALADPIGVYVGPVFSAYDAGTVLTTSEAWIGALSYTLQLYFDFSGYCDMAVGISLMFGIRIPVNFFSPYKANNIIDFWRRWNMTLSRFLRDYLYIPLGGNRHGSLMRWRNLMITMLLGGLWHGAAWTFVIWGGLHGLYLAINHAFRSAGGRLPVSIAGAITFLAVVVGWVLFRAGTIDGALAMLKSMAGLGELGSPDLTQAAHVAILLAVVFLLPNVYQLTARFRPGLLPVDFTSEAEVSSVAAWRPNFVTGLVAGCAVAVAIFMITREVVPSEFLYFQF